MQKDLKLQQELFLTFTIDRLAPLPNPAGKGASPAAALAKGQSPRPSNAKNSPLLIPADKQETGTPLPSRLVTSPARVEIRDFILETLSHIGGHPSFMVDLFTNYDCDVNCENLFERLIDFLTKVRGAFSCIGETLC